MTEMHHPTADRLEGFAGGSLEGGDRVIVESHLLGCQQCRTAVEEWRALFAALSSLPQLEPSLGFADRVMAGVRVQPRRSWQQSWQQAWQQHAARAGAALQRVAPKTTYGWGLAVALLALPVLLGGGALAWLLSRSYVTPATLWTWTSQTLVQGLQGVGATAIAAVLETDVAAWVVARGAEFIETAGLTGVGALAAFTGLAMTLSIWILYRNLFRTPTRESHYATYSF